MLSRFVRPEPREAVIRASTRLNRALMLRGVPGLRYLSVLGRIAPLRGLTHIREIDFPDEAKERLRGLIGPGKATFLTPNHPEFFTDWMIDKEVLSHVAPLAACWATHTVVNGLGRGIQRFWLWNNLIAQIPGQAEKARDHSVEWAMKGHGVLLHPEGAVGWHADHMGPIFSGSAEMAMEALKRGRDTGECNEAFIAPLAYKLAFIGDVRPALGRECAYVARKLKISEKGSTSVAERIYHIYAALMSREEDEAGFAGDPSKSLRQRRDRLAEHLEARVAEAIGLADSSAGTDEVLRQARRFRRELPRSARAARKELDSLTQRHARINRLRDFAFLRPQITQEQMAEHLKRLRTDYCKSGLRDVLGAFIPQAVGPRTLHIRALEPFAIHEWSGDAGALTEALRERLQQGLDSLNSVIAETRPFTYEANPFYRG